MRRTHLPIAEPCHEDWDAMDPVERGRFCHGCEKRVFDLSSMTERQAAQVLREHAKERICVRYCHDADGVVRFRPERPMRAAALALALVACAPHAQPQQDEPVFEPEEAHVVGMLEAPPEHTVKGEVGPSVEMAVMGMPEPPKADAAEDEGDEPKEPCDTVQAPGRAAKPETPRSK